MTYQQFQEQWEQEAEKEMARYAEKPLEELLALIAKHHFGRYHQVWGAIADKASVKDVGLTMYDFITSDMPYENRYNCAVALIGMFPYSGIRPCDVTLPGPARKYHLGELMELIQKIHRGVNVGNRTS